MKKVAVAILNWNGVNYLERFLPSVVEHSALEADVWVIDNASTDGSLAFIREKFPQVNIKQLESNFGFAKGYNLGLKDIPNEVFVLLNSDVEVSKGWIAPVIRYMESTAGMVACQPKILDYNDKKMYEYAGAAGGYVDQNGFVFCAGRIFNSFEQDEGQYAGNEEVFWASGAALFITRKAYYEVDGLDEDFFAHMEEIDLCWRLKNRGYRVGACRDTQVYHVGGGTLNRLSPFKTYLNFRNNLYLLVKNYRGSNLFCKMYWRLTLDGVAFLHFCTVGKFNYALAVLKAHASYYKNLKLYLRKRKAEEQFSKVPNMKGWYRGSIVGDFFLKKKKKFWTLERERFV